MSSLPGAGVASPFEHRVDVRRRRMYLATAVAFTLVATIGFAPTYWAPLVAGTLTAHPAIHVHAALFFLWLGFLVLQAALRGPRLFLLVAYQ